MEDYGPYNHQKCGYILSDSITTIVIKSTLTVWGSICHDVYGYSRKRSDVSSEGLPSSSKDLGTLRGVT